MMIIILFIFSILLSILSSTPFYIWQLSLIFLLPLFLILEKYRGFLTFFIFGLFYYTYHLFWLLNLSKIVPEIKYILPIGLLILIIIESGMLGICGILTKKFLNSKFSFILIPSFFAGIEYFRNLFEIAFPWAPFYLFWVKNLRGIQIIEITGPFFITFLIVFLNLLLYNFLKKRNFSYILIFILIILLNQIYGIFSLKKEFKGKEIKVAIYQPNLYLYLSYDEEIKEGFKTYKELSDSIKGFNPLISLWPESSLPGNLRFNPFIKEFVKEFAIKEKTYIFLGSQDKEDKKIYNTVFLVSPEGEIISKYHKVKLVPFGEAIPYDEKFDFLKKIDFGEGNFSRGKNLSPLKIGDYLFGTLICYESIFPELSRNLVLKGAQAILNLTSDGWYGKTIGPIEHRDLFIFRSIETRRYLLRSARTGISCIIDPFGKILYERGLFKKGIIKAKIILPDKNYKTFYVKYGEIFGKFSSSILILSIFISFIKK